MLEIAAGSVGRRKREEYNSGAVTVLNLHRLGEHLPLS